MSERRFLYLAALLSAALFTLHFLALKFFLYWHYSWFDLLVHALGGMIVGLLASFFLSRSHKEISRKPKYLIVIFIALAVSVIWEYFEVAIGATFAGENYVSDTLFDLVMTIAGAFVALYFSRAEFVQIPSEKNL